MIDLLSYILNDLLRGIIGDFILFNYYKITGKNISLKQISTEIDDFGVLKYGFISNFTGVFVVMIIIFLLLKITSIFHF